MTKFYQISSRNARTGLIELYAHRVPGKAIGNGHRALGYKTEESARRNFTGIVIAFESDAAAEAYVASLNT